MYLSKKVIVTDEVMYLSGVRTFGRRDVWMTDVWVTFSHDDLGDTGCTFGRQQLDV